jgi:hypothetical protein
MAHSPKTLATAALLMLCMAGARAGQTHESYVRYSGTATALHSDLFLYRENDVVHFHDGKITGRVVLYTCRDGSAFARKTVTYVDPLSPDFTLEDASNGMREGIRSSNHEREVFFRSDAAAAEKSRAMPRVDGLVADSGFDEFVQMNWQALMSGQTLGMDFLVPSRLHDIGFQVRHVGSEQLEGRKAEIFRLKLSGVWGWILPGIDVYYDAADHILMRYVGLSDLRDRSNDNLKTAITFPPEDRQAGAEQDLVAARQARLAPCNGDR